MLPLINLIVKVKVPQDTEMVGVDEIEFGKKTYVGGTLKKTG